MPFVFPTLKSDFSFLALTLKGGREADRALGVGWGRVSKSDKSNKIRFQNFHTKIKAVGRKHIQVPLLYFIEK